MTRTTLMTKSRHHHTDFSSLLDHADEYDPPQPSVHLSALSRVSRPSRPSTSTSLPRYAANRTSLLYPQYATLLQSVVEEVSDASSSTPKAPPADYYSYKRRRDTADKVRIVRPNSLSVSVDAPEIREIRRVRRPNAVIRHEHRRRPRMGTNLVTSNVSSSATVTFGRENGHGLCRYELALSADSTVSQSPSEATGSEMSSESETTASTETATHSESTNAIVIHSPIGSMNSKVNHSVAIARRCAQRVYGAKGAHSQSMQTQTRRVTIIRRRSHGQNTRGGYAENVSEEQPGNETMTSLCTAHSALESLSRCEHSMCKKEVHEAYERGFLAGYFLGVNMQKANEREKKQMAGK